MSNNYRCIIKFFEKDTGHLRVEGVSYTDDIAKRYDMSDDVKRFMLEELNSTGRYWINDDKLVRRLREE